VSPQEAAGVSEGIPADSLGLSLLIAGLVEQAEATVERALELEPESRTTQGLADFIAMVRAGERARPERWP